MAVEEQERIDSVNKYIRGDKPVNICRDVGRSKTWLFTWVSRFENGEEEWYKSQSRAPKNHGRKTGTEIESTIVNIRKALMAGNEHESKYLGVGADAIQYRMEKQGFSKDVIPSASTIKRIVKTHGLKGNKRERYKRVKSKKRYTILNPTQINEMHQIDFVGPRFIKGYGAVSSLNLIDLVCSPVHIAQYDTKSTDNIIDFLIWYWRNNPIPRYLQVDNGMYFIGDFKYPRRFSRFVRSCLYVGVEVVFINPKSPWMNGSIENFNGWFDEKFWAILNNSLKIPLGKLPLTKGKIHFIRMVDNDGKISVLNEAFKVGNEFISEYVWATICLKKQTLEVFYRAKDQDTAVLIKDFEYELSEEVKPLKGDTQKF